MQANCSMNQAINLTPITPIRSQPSHRSEMVSQLLFGEGVKTGNTQDEFVEVQAMYDGYTGWVQQRQLTPVEALPANWQIATHASSIMINGAGLMIPAGSQVPMPGTHSVGNYQLQVFEQFEAPAATGADKIILLAQQYLGASYLWGGKSNWGVDCSGLTQTVYKMAGLFLPRDAWQQAEKGEALGFLQEAQPGDLAFFDNAEGRITHVGIMLSPRQILHASAQVRIDDIDSQGIIHSGTGHRTHRLRILKRYL